MLCLFKSKKGLLFFAALLVVLQPLLAAPFPVKGKVVDKTGNPLNGVSVLLKGTELGTSTNAAGEFSINVPETGGVLVFSIVNFASQEQPVNSSTGFLNVSLTETQKMLDDVVVVGYGTQRRGEVTSAVASVKANDFVKGAATDPAQLIRGKVAGLAIIVPDGNPTATAQVSLRGTSTLKAGSDPLIIIDGVPGSLTTVVPEDVESFDVLKDGSAAAIYGTRGTNGVILITTKKGRGRGSAVEINSYLTTQKIRKRLNFFDAAGYRKLVEEGKTGATDYGSNTDWLDEIAQRPISQVHNISIRGASENTSYIVNLNYRKINGIIKRSDNQTIYPRIEVTHNMFNRKIRLNANLSGFHQNYFAGGDGDSYREDVYRNAMYYNPTDAVRDANGNYNEHVDKTDYANPVSLLEQTEGRHWNTNLRTVGTATYTPITGLDIMALGSIEVWNSIKGYSESKLHYSTLHDGRNGFASRGTIRNKEDLLELTATYKKTLQDHAFTVLGGYSWRTTDYQDYWMQNWDFPSSDYSFNNMGAGLALRRGQAPEYSYRRANKLIGFFARVNYSYKDKYLLMASMRREGSSKFGANHKWGNFPAISVGWNMKNEDFLQRSKSISTLRLRAGYGITGTEPTDPYMSLNRINFNTYTLINGQWMQVISPSTNANPDLRWEKKKELNLGVDVGFLGDRITASIDVYRRETEDLLFDYPVPLPPYLFDRITANAASMENKGIEVQVNVSAIERKNFRWNSSVNFSANRNKILSLSDKNFQLASGFIDAGFLAEPIQQPTSRAQIGGPIGNFWGFKSIDIDDEGHWIIEGKDGKPKPINEQQADDKQVIGNGVPKLFLNFNNNFSYKQFDLSITMRGAFGFEILNTPRIWYETPVMMTRGNLLTTAYDNVYGKRPLAEDQSVNYVSYFVEKGDYWKIDNVTLGYNLTLDHKYFKGIRFYASTSNLAVITGYSGIDPEVGITGLAPGIDDRNRYPAITSYTLGTILKF